MPLFGLRTTKKNEQSHLENAAGATKAAIAKNKRNSGASGKAVKAEKAVTIPETRNADTKAVAMPKGSFSTGTEAILRPHITEKSGVLSEKNVYTFQVAKTANKDTIAKAVKSLYKVTPVKIGIVNIPSKKVFVRGKRGVVSGMKKAIVTLKAGDKIDFV